LFGPLFQREAVTLPRQWQHFAGRAAYLGLLGVVGITAWQSLVGWGREASLGETARFGQALFPLWAALQLTVLVFLAALSAATAIAREKDRGTFLLLLVTDLSNAEIVLGKVFAGLLPVAVLGLATVPVWLLSLLLGGVEPAQLGQLALLLAATAWAAASVGGLLALWRERSFPALALTALAVILYPSLVRVAGTLCEAAHATAWLEPLAALQAIVEDGDRPADTLPPVWGYAAAMFGIGVAANAWGMVRLRAWNPPADRARRPPADGDRAAPRAPAGKPREVGRNPILWREVRTRAYGRQMLLIKAAYLLVLGLLCGSLVTAPADGHRSPFAAAYALVPVAILSLLLTTLQAVTAITTERDGRALDLLLATDLTPREFIFGKIAGICYNAREYLLAPLLVAGYAAHRGWLASAPRHHPELLPLKNLEAFVAVAVGLLVLHSFVIVLGLHLALRTTDGRRALFHALGTVFFLSAGTLICIYLVLISPRFEYQWGTFVLFVAAGIGGLWWVLSGDRPSPALTLASWLCPVAVLYAVLNVLIGKPGSPESADPLAPLVVIAGAFGFAIAAMLVPLLSEFDVALGRTTAVGDR
jgi:ABC-type Na+ efflux pump permease subunit